MITLNFGREQGASALDDATKIVQQTLPLQPVSQTEPDQPMEEPTQHLTRPRMDSDPYHFLINHSWIPPTR